MLLNLSNHPSVKWPENQTKEAIKKYHEIQDLPFPQINPAATTEEIDQLAEEYVNQIREINPAAVHIMGEMTFTYNLVQKLKSTGIICLASTTERNSEEIDGVKTSTFKFVQFREY